VTLLKQRQTMMKRYQQPSNGNVRARHRRARLALVDR
jgi:hypothetical protein